MNYDSLYYPYKSQRMSVFAKGGMVATSQPLAAQAGLEMLKKGGNAIDAAVAAAACLSVVEPTSNGIGGDAFAIVWVNNKLYGLNSSGPAPKTISIEEVKKQGYREMPQYGLLSVTVPGIPAAWANLSAKFGKLALTEILRPAIKYAAEGYPLTPILAKNWGRAFHKYQEILRGEEFKPWFETFTIKGRAPQIGEVWRSPDHAQTLRSIAETGAESFYRGELAEKIAAFFKRYGGFLSGADLADFHPEWVEPIKLHYRGYDVWEIPPNGQGLNTLMALNILQGYEFTAKDSVDAYHKQIEAMKLAFTDGQQFISDPRYMKFTVDNLLSKTFAAERRNSITEVASEPVPGTPPRGGTVYLAAADGDGNMISYIQSNYKGFGSGIVIPGTGIALQNRGKDFSLDPNHVNALQGGKKTYHTIIPGFLTKDNQAIGPFGVMGGFMQPQGHLQVIMNTIDFNLNPQASLDAPRWMWQGGKAVHVEPHFPDHIAQSLQRKGHQIVKSLDEVGFGRGQIIWRDSKTGVLNGGTDPRTDGHISCY
ncbi:MAG: gamma-glutamyltransferase family protein [Peptococcaceae bacterium]